MNRTQFNGVPAEKNLYYFCKMNEKLTVRFPAPRVYFGQILYLLGSLSCTNEQSHWETLSFNPLSAILSYPELEKSKHI